MLRFAPQHRVDYAEQASKVREKNWYALLNSYNPVIAEVIGATSLAATAPPVWLLLRRQFGAVCRRLLCSTQDDMKRYASYRR